MKTALCLGAGGFICSHLVKRLKKEGYWVRGVDLKFPEFSQTEADDFIVGDLRDPMLVSRIMIAPWQTSLTDKENSFDIVFQLAADMGGSLYCFSGENDANIMHNSALVNLNVLEEAKRKNVKKIFFSSSACIYPEHNQLDPENPNCTEDSAYPAAPDSEYGFEKLFSERLYLAYARNYGMQVRIARFHNIFGPEGTWQGGKEKAPAAVCRKIATSTDGKVEVIGSGKQTRSFLYVDECIEGVLRLINSDFQGPVNIGSDEMVTINVLFDIVSRIANKKIEKVYIDGPIGVNGRNSDSTLIYNKLGWKPNRPLIEGLILTYEWISSQCKVFV